MEKQRYSLRELRARHNLTQADMAKKIGISLTTYNNWENNFGRLSVNKANTVASILGVTLDEIFFADSLESKSSKVV